MAKKQSLVSKIFVFIIILFLTGTGVYFGQKIYYNLAYPLKYKEYVDKYSKEFSVDKALVYAVIKTESGFEPNAVSKAGAKGLMQITYDTFEWAKLRKDEINLHDYDNITDPEVNIKYGTYILSLLLGEFGNEQVALCAYNAGWGSAKSWLSDREHSKDGKIIDNIPFEETKNYVSKVLKSKEVYNKYFLNLNIEK